MKLFFVFDKKSSFCDVFLSRDQNSAKRGFICSVGNPETLLAQFPEDYDLYFMPKLFDADLMKIDLEHLCFANFNRAELLCTGLEAAEFIKRRQSVRVDADATTAAATSSPRSGRDSAKE